MSDRPRVVMTSASEMATDARICREAEALVRAGYAVTIICLASSQPARVRGATLVEVPHRRFPERVRLPAAFLLLVLRTVVTRADVYHAHNAPMLPAAWLAATLHRAKLVYDAHELFSPDLVRRVGTDVVSRRTRAEAWIERVLAPRADVRITVSQRYADAIGAALALPPPTPVPNYPVLPERFEQSPLRSLAGAGDQDILILYQGGYYLATRRLDVVIRGMRLLPEHYKLAFVGFGVRGEERQLAELIAREGLQARAVLLPPVPHQHLLQLTAGADIGVIPFALDRPAMRICSPNKIYEYMAAGVAVLSAAADELVEVLAETGAGITYDTADPRAFAAAVRQLGPDRASLHRVGERGRAAAEARYSWERSEDALLEVYPRVPAGMRRR